MNPTVPERIAAVLTAFATAFVITAIAIVPFLTPAWVSFEQGRTDAAALTGFTTHELDYVTGEILNDLVFGGDFAVSVDAAYTPVLNDRERGHMIDVRGVFAAFALVALLAAAGLAAAFFLARRMGHADRAWSAIRAGARGLAVGVVIAGVIAFFAFDAAFEVFHRLFFAGGSYTFDPGTDRLVQLFPFAFWSETTMAVGLVIIVLSLVVATLAGRRAQPHAPPMAGEASSALANPANPEAAR